MRESLTLRLIYISVFLALSWPLVQSYTLPPARMYQADKIYELVEDLTLTEGEIVLIAMDYGPNTIAENRPQSEMLIEHLMRRRIPFATFSLYALASPFLESVPRDVAAKLMEEHSGEKWTYGKDWVNLGFQPGHSLALQSIAKSSDLQEYFKKDANGTPLSDIPAFRGVRTIEDIKMLAEFTGLAGMVNAYIQFFQSERHRPLFVHGCTSITIPDAYIYLDSGQLTGLFEGIAGAAWYTVLLSKAYPGRDEGEALIMNTALGVAHLVLLALILLGNLVYLNQKRRGQA